MKVSLKQQTIDKATFMREDQKIFCQVYIDCGCALEAYKQVYPEKAKDLSDTELHKTVKRLLNNPRILLKIQSLKIALVKEYAPDTRKMMVELEACAERLKLAGDEKNFIRVWELLLRHASYADLSNAETLANLSRKDRKKRISELQKVMKGLTL